MVSINIKQRKELLKEMNYARSAEQSFNDIYKRPGSAWKKLLDALEAEEYWSLVGKE